MRLVVKLAIGVALGAITASPAAAQSTLFNIPSTDTVAEKAVYGEFDYFMQLPKPESGQFQIFAPRIIFGVTPQVEVGANVGITHYADDGGNYLLFQPNVKYKFFADDDAGLAASAGVIGYIANNDGDHFGQVYANVSKKMSNGSRVTAGGYGAISCDYCDGGANKGGVLLGLEQPVAPNVSIVIDWFSGKNFWGLFTPGVSFVLPHNGLLNIGYSIGNDSWGDDTKDYRNRALFIYYGLLVP